MTDALTPRARTVLLNDLTYNLDIAHGAVNREADRRGADSHKLMRCLAIYRLAAVALANYEEETCPNQDPEPTPSN